MLKNVLKKIQMSEKYWGCLDIMSEVNFSPAETLICCGDGSFEYPQHMLWLRNKKNNFQLCSFIWRHMFLVCLNH